MCVCHSQLEILETKGWLPRVSSFTLKKKKSYCLKECLDDEKMEWVIIL